MHTVITHVIYSISLGPCLDQHPACGLVAIRGSEMERGGLVLRQEDMTLEVSEGW